MESFLKKIITYSNNSYLFKKDVKILKYLNGQVSRHFVLKIHLSIHVHESVKFVQNLLDCSTPRMKLVRTKGGEATSRKKRNILFSNPLFR